MALGVAVFYDLSALHLHFDFELSIGVVGNDIVNGEAESEQIVAKLL